MTAEAVARAHVERWARVVELTAGFATAALDPEPTEGAVVGVEVVGDLQHRARRWGHHFTQVDLAEIARFGAGLALAEAEAWASGDAITATQAYEDRRFLLSDRLVHWAVPWLCCLERDHPGLAPQAAEAWSLLADLAEEARIAPDLAGVEGMVVPGEDSFGPLEPPPGPLSLLSGDVLVRSTGAGDVRTSIMKPAERFTDAAVRWDSLAGRYPGSARLWLDLAARARRTAAQLADC